LWKGWIYTKNVESFEGFDARDLYTITYQDRRQVQAKTGGNITLTL
jgi:hypothetical protein